MEATISHSKDALKCAFDSFNRVSEDLTDAYSHLEHRLENLQQELIQTRDEKFHQLIEKEKLADRLSILLRTLPVGVLVLDDYGNIVEHNAIAEKLIGADLENKHWHKIAKKYFAPGYSGNCEICLKNDKRISLKIETQRRGEGKIVLINDVTEEYAYKETLSRKDRLESLGNMVASLAHQVRTPLSAAFLYCSGIEKRIAKQDLSFQLVENLKHCLHGLEKTVNDMLSYAKGEWHICDVLNLEDLVDDLRVDINNEFGNYLISINLHVPNEFPRLSINYTALWGALKNVIQNAIQASEFNSNVELDISLDGVHVIFSIKDQGNGIPDELKEKIFEPFFTTKTGGTGLGLAVVQSIVKAHKGTVEAVNGDVKGTCINIRIPKYSEFLPIKS